MPTALRECKQQPKNKTEVRYYALNRIGTNNAYKIFQNLPS